MFLIRVIHAALATIAFAVAAMSVAAPVHAQPPPVKASVDNDRPYLGQQITYIFQIYRGPGLPILSGRVHREPPGFAGFWNSHTTEPREYNETIDSLEYTVNEWRTALFPTVIGVVTIDPASLLVHIDTSGAAAILESAPVMVEVRPLPSGALPRFTGAVGRFEISAEVDVTAVTVNQPVRFTVTVSGNGNIEALPQPAWPEFAGWRVIESPVRSDSHIVGGEVTGSRIYELSLVPEQVGELTIPEVRYPYFDPGLEQYVPAATTPIAVSIASADGSPTIPPLPAVAEADEDGPEMRPIKPVPASLHQTGTELTDNSVYWVAWAIPALAIAGAAAWRRRRLSLDAARSGALRHSALPDSKASLARALESGNDPRVAAANAVLSYLSACLEAPVSGLTRGALLQKLREAGASSALEQRLAGVLAAGDAAAYAPIEAFGGSGQNYASDAGRLLEELDEVVGG